MPVPVNERVQKRRAALRARPRFRGAQPAHGSLAPALAGVEGEAEPRGRLGAAGRRDLSRPAGASHRHDQRATLAARVPRLQVREHLA